MSLRSAVPGGFRASVPICAAAVLLAAVGCTSGASDLASGSGSSAADVQLTITPKDGGADIAPDRPITVTAEDGTITDVAVEQVTPEGDDADAVTGTLNEEKTEWTSDWTLTPGSEVTVTAAAENSAGDGAEAISAFSTLPATEGKRLELKKNLPLSGDTVGVGMPVMIDFDMPVQNKAKVEAAMEVTSEKPATGAWNWFSDKRAVFRPKEYWKTDQTVTVDLRLAGVQASEGVYGIENHQIEFEVGRSQVTEIDENAHHMTVERDGEVVKEFPVSLGKATTNAYTTTSGTHLTMHKFTDFRMSNDTLGVDPESPEWYEEYVDYAVQISHSGEFLHTADWNYRLGEANTSHGCINMSVPDSEWFYSNSVMGDPVVITGTDRELEVDNGWGYWQRSWEEWLGESALGEADATDQAGTPGSPHSTA